ncbi:MAG: universal stress protein UspA [Rhodobacterales bacterium CG18_big_fil_WC_8_21_14_2_50_71_9]|nr:MAG: universal stress protein UspA [Rhodobacterales bacterium CG18_big_fil_WC_8_21_14_2_50_71_9]
MTMILACIDGSIYSHSVADHAGWAAKRLGASVEVLQVLGRREAASSDRSGRIVAGARRQLLEELATLDAERAKLLQRQGRLDLEEARTRIEAAGVASVATTLRNGDLLETVAERETGADLVVIGKRGEAADFARLHLGSNLERIVRASTRPVLVTSRAFRPIRRFLLAFDGRASALKAVDAVSRSPLFAGLACDLVTVGGDTAEARQRLDAAAAQLRAGGVEVSARIEPGQPDTAIGAAVEREAVGLVVMGAYGHSRLRSLMIGSTTSELIRACKTPIMVFR